MLPIPKELQNQKAIPFMEWCVKNAIITTVTENGQIRGNYFEIPEYFFNFYNQPFTHESLRLFEGWGENTCYDVIHGGSKVASNEYKLMYCDEFVMAFETLNDFITLCNLAGVTLMWKGTE